MRQRVRRQFLSLTSSAAWDILFPALAAARNGAERGPSRLFVRTTGIGRRAYFGLFSGSLAAFSLTQPNHAHLAEAHARITDTLDSWREVGRLDPPVWADASGTDPALPLVRPSRRKPARVERRAVVYGRAGPRYIATVVLGTG